MSDGDLYQLTYVKESTFKTTPVDSENWNVFRCTGDNISDSPQTEESEEISGTEVGVVDALFLGLDTNGDIPIEFSSDSFDDFLEAVLGGTWSVGVLKGGTTKRSFTLQGYQPDLSGSDKYLYRRGAVANAFNLEFSAKAKVTGSIGFICGDSAIGSADLLGIGTAPTATTTAIMKTGTSITNIRIDGVLASASGIRVKSIKLAAQREQEGEDQVDQNGFSGVIQKTLRPEITVEMYFDDFVMYKKLLDQTEFSFGWDITDGTNVYTFYQARNKITSGAPDGAAKGAGRMHTWTALGLTDATDSPLKITKA